ncbi:MAG: ribonuclease HI family protein [Candidatus Bathyarchaeota archaeon]|nr:ribonuclease HI family protein [Candidatus Bathyarchaeota archaeon]MDH5779318.1 ribonuclease HI family protein [Candidatus Bathyarchaeota archaeon]
MIEVWIDGLCEPVIPKHERTACLGYVIKKNDKVVEKGSEVVGIGEDMTNNVAEYAALIRALERIKDLVLEGPVIVRSDSRLVVNQMRGDWRVKAPLIVPLYHQAVALADGRNIVFEWVAREKNTEADHLAHNAYDTRQRRH